MAATNGFTNGAANGSVYGRRLLPHVVDDMAAREPDRECFSAPRSSDPKDGWEKVTFKQFANGINHVAQRVLHNCGLPPADSCPTIAYVGPNDARYLVLTLAAVKAGYKALFISPRNSQEGQMSLFDKTDCRIIVFPKSHRNMVQPWLQERDMQAIEVGPVANFFPEKEVEPFPYNKTFEEAEWDPLCVMHTSGSTGLPKPIIVRMGMLAISDQYWNHPTWNGRMLSIWGFRACSKRNFVPMPLFHAAGLYCFMVTSLYFETPLALGLPDRPLSAELVAECLENVGADATMLPPALLEDMSQSERTMEPLKKLNLVCFAGGNLALEAGDRLANSGVRINNLISATEFLPFPIYLQSDPKLWQYFVINSEEFGADWRKVEGEDDVYRLVAVRKAKEPGLQGFFYTFPELQEYDTKDMYKPHPTLPDHWRYYGRSDDIIVFSNGEKLNPVTIEGIVSDHPELSGAIVAGEGRFQPSLILEPLTFPASAHEGEELIDRIWPLVIAANKQTVAHGQIGRAYIVLADPTKPFARAGKGTVQRANTIKLYRPEIDALYERVENVTGVDSPQLDISSEEGLTKSIQGLFKARMGAESEIAEDADFFSAGVDSMQVISASRLLRAGLESAGHHVEADSLATRVIYGNPTPRRLARYIFSLVKQGGGGGHTAGDETLQEVEAMKALWRKYSSDPPQAIPGRPEADDENQVVVITGSTGMLGSYMLDLMVRNPGVDKVVCLNRAEDGGRKRQKSIMAERGLTADYEAKTTFLHADMSRSDFGLEKEDFKELLLKADRFIHNAWPVNFNIPTESFEPHIRSVRNIGDFAARSAKRVAVVFISSIGTADRWDAKAGTVPEARLEDLSLPSGGYGRSKMVGSLVLEDVARGGADFPAAIIRVGQIAGPQAEAGVWNKQEWLPSIVASSLHLGALPRSLGSMERVDWTPVEGIAGMVLDVAGVAHRVRPGDVEGYYHGVNPEATTWGELVSAVQEYYGKERIPRIVSLREWVELLDQSQTGDIQTLEKNPGVKLLDSYRGMAVGEGAGVEGAVVFEMGRTRARSEATRRVRPVTRELMVHWCRQWGF
ncbi:hypothetical protein F4808DRAFT_327585 [Astrocystis sublimbata]|nr:hypothetical protein F4808DRAFT_327585 [Astrocystis sublimbata]